MLSIVIKDETEQLLNALKLANIYYNSTTLHHVLRVAEYTRNYPTDRRDFTYIIAICHDILEDTSCTEEILYDVLGEEITEAVKILTIHEDEDYTSYIKRVVDSNNTYVINVKRADMKDHLSLEKSLTDALKAKYYPTIKYLL